MAVVSIDGSVAGSAAAIGWWRNAIRTQNFEEDRTLSATTRLDPQGNAVVLTPIDGHLIRRTNANLTQDGTETGVS